MSYVHDFTAARTSLGLKLLLCYVFYLNIWGGGGAGESEFLCNTHGLFYNFVYYLRRNHVL